MFTISNRHAVRFAVALWCAVALQYAIAGTFVPRQPEPKAVQVAQSIRAVAGDDVRISYHAATGRIRFLGAQPQKGVLTQQLKSLAASGAAPEQTARAFLREYGAGFGITDADKELSVMRTKSTVNQGSAVRFQQMYQNLPVIGGEFIVHQDAKRAVTCVIGEAMPELNLDTVPTISPREAEEKARILCAKHYHVSPAVLTATEPQLSVYAPQILDSQAPGQPALVWQLEIQSTSDEQPVREYVLVDAKTGKIALHFSKVYHAKYRKVYDCNSTSNLPGTLVRSEGQPPSSIADVNAAYDGTGSTYDFYWNYFGRDSIDGAGMNLLSSVRYCPSSWSCPYLNAFWDGSKMVFGANMTADDVCAHELTHGVTEHESNLFYYMQSGAINESLSDIFGEFTDLTNGIGNDSPAVRWKIGEDLPASIGIIRDMANPPLYGQPDNTSSMLYWCDASSDNGGVHINSGIPNKCAQLMVDGGTHYGWTVTGIGLPKTARIWYEVNCNYLTSAADFQDLYDALLQASTALAGTTVYGGGTITLADAQQVLLAAIAVQLQGIPQSCPNQEKEAFYCVDVQMRPFDIWYDNLENPASGRWQTGFAVGGNIWYYPQNTHPYTGWDATYATSGVTNFFGDDLDARRDSWIQMTQSVAIPTTPTAVYMHFRHAYDFENGWDGGVVEYSTDNGTMWNDGGVLMDAHYYPGRISTTSDNPLAGRYAFTGTSYGYVSTRLDLTPLKGMNVRFRFRIGTDSSVGSLGWFIDDIRIYTCGYKVDTKNDDPMQSPNGWFEFERIPSTGGLASTDFDANNQAIRVRVSSDPTRYRIAGWLANTNNWLPYLYVGSNNFVRGKFYVYATGQANPSQLNTIPNFRMRLANRFAVTSMLEVLPHSNATSGDEPISLELRPSQDPTRPSLYRVDFDPIDVISPLSMTEGITRGFEIYALDPQDNGYVCLTESSIGVYPKSAVSVAGSNLMWLATYAPTSTGAGDLDPTKSGATLDRFSMIMPSNPGDFPTRDNSVYPSVSAGPWGVTIDSTSFDNQGGSRVGVVQIDFSPDVSTGQRVRIEPYKQYMIKYHVVSSQQSNLNPQLRLRVRTVRFAWTQKYEVGGAWAIDTPEHTALTRAALPGIGCENPDKWLGTENGGWYTVLMHSPLNIDIRPDMTGTLAERMPNLIAQPGPGQPGTSLRDLKVAFDMIDTMSGSTKAYLEAGNFTVDRIEVYSFDQIPD
jgi:Zn-dependent metalloprotease